MEFNGAEDPDSVKYDDEDDDWINQQITRKLFDFLKLFEWLINS